MFGRALAGRRMVVRCDVLVGHALALPRFQEMGEDTLARGVVWLCLVMCLLAGSCLAKVSGEGRGCLGKGLDWFSSCKHLISDL